MIQLLIHFTIVYHYIHSIRWLTQFHTYPFGYLAHLRVSHYDVNDSKILMDGYNESINSVIGPGSYEFTRSKIGGSQWGFYIVSAINRT